MEKYKKILEKLEWDKNRSCEKYEFGMYEIDKREVFLTTKYSYGFVNNKPLLPGHILLTTLKKKKKYNDLDIEEIIDINLLSNFMCYVMGILFNTNNFSIAIQDGKDAGQTVDHLHIHIIPRKNLDYKNNNNIYKDLNKVNLGYGRNILCNSCNHSINVLSQIPVTEIFKLEEFNTSIRSIEEMEKEANLIKSYIDKTFSS
ncbi:histidine triad protein [Plasmodium brasilianum]|uniref:Bis(5'-adenosyl)-triphosphatase n=2 Tax=Plasmodium (Plasmodium) TaxID=418103 RepID=A0A1D3TCH7_PLAMA|nr:histidine triad protein, putative [Plasmodium malariae]KAI4835658.1 histidine triad protein [Plasmodium brasilianum]SCP02587.1 histidine triad protein, putative [Plasmodium malariae]